MNIFFLHPDPRVCARYHGDKHVIKMILETCQLLCSVWHITDPLHHLYSPPYKRTHTNHPCTRWACKSLQNYSWLCCLGKELCIEYTHRYGKVHKCEDYIRTLYTLQPNVKQVTLTSPPLCMPNKYKTHSKTTA